MRGSGVLFLPAVFVVLIGGAVFRLAQSPRQAWRRDRARSTRRRYRPTLYRWAVRPLERPAKE
jgi:hypothetical protein